MKKLLSFLMFGALSAGVSLTAHSVAGESNSAIDLSCSSDGYAEGPGPWTDAEFVNWFFRKAQCETAVLALREDKTQQVYVNGHRLSRTSGVRLCVSPWNVISSHR